MRNRRLIGSIVGLLFIGATFAQEAVTDATLKGVWQVSGSAWNEVLTFASNNDLIVSRTISKDVPPTTTASEGAYKFGAAACSVGTEKGNLWMVKESQRCCFNAYMMGRTLVLDEVRSP